jgi:hypothetical protein
MTWLAIVTLDPSSFNIEFFVAEQGAPNTPDEEGYFSYFRHQAGTERAKALKDPVLVDP